MRGTNTHLGFSDVDVSVPLFVSSVVQDVNRFVSFFISPSNLPLVVRVDGETGVGLINLNICLSEAVLNRHT